MRTMLSQLLAIAMCFGLFIVTCPLTAQAAASAPEPSSCCIMSGDAQHCAPSNNLPEEPERCCVSHTCTSVISVAAAVALTSPIGAPQFLFSFAQTIVARADQPLVPPPRSAAA